MKDQRKQDYAPAFLDFGSVGFYIPRHFGFCYGVENAIEISYRALEENPGKAVYLLSQMIHNQEVNADLQDRGIQFIMDTDGTQYVPWDKIDKNDIVIIPAFGTTLETLDLLLDKGVEVQKYNTTCPFVEKVWNRAEKLGDNEFTIIIHGKPSHEETRATFSHSKSSGPSVIIRDMEDAVQLSAYILGDRPDTDFFNEFAGKFSNGFDPQKHLQRIGVVNQTTMLASETQDIANYLKGIIAKKFGEGNIKDHFADTRDTLCYATNDNQQATYKLLETDANLALVVGGYNSSNTSHIVELCERNFPTYFINSDTEIKSSFEIHHFNYPKKERCVTKNFLPEAERVKIVLTSGASCPDTLVDRVLQKILSYYPGSRSVEEVLQEFD